MHRKALQELLLQVAGLVVLAALAVTLGLAVRDNPDIAALITQFGYPGLLIASIVSGFNILVPIPIATFVPAFLSAGMEPSVIVLTITLGTSLADTASYIIGKAARTFVLSRHQAKMQDLLERLHKRHDFAPILALYLFASFMPLPNEVAVIPLALLGYKLRPIVIAVVLGNLTFNTLVTLGAMNIV